MENKKIYTVYTNTDTADKIVQYKMNTDDEKKIPHKFSIFKHINKNDTVVVGYLKNECSTESEQENPVLYFQENNTKYYAPLFTKKPWYRYNIGYVPVEKAAYAVLTKNWIPLILFPLLLIMLLFLLFLPTGDDKKEVEISDNTVSMQDISTEAPIPEQKMAYISGQAITVITQNQPNVYLPNDPENTEYYLEYAVYLNDGNTPVYTTKKIPCNSAEEWNAYECNEVHTGENNIWYKVSVYDLEGELLANTTVDGLTLIKK